jgi:hypothetical protein
MSGKKKIKERLDSDALAARLAAWKERSPTDPAPPPLGSSAVSEEIFLVSEEDIMFPATLSAGDRRTVHRAADNLSLHHETLEDADAGTKVICVSRGPLNNTAATTAAKAKAKAIDKNPPKPHTPHAALALSADQRAMLMAAASAPHNPTSRAYKVYLQGVAALASGVPDLSACDADIVKNPCVMVHTLDGLLAAAAHMGRCREFGFDLEMHSVR